MKKTAEMEKGMRTGKKLTAEILSGKWDEALKKLYMDNQKIQQQKKRYVKAVASYCEIFGEMPVEIYSAPGRSEVGGNHTDHQHGRVLAASVSLDAIAVAGRVYEPLVRIQSEGYKLCEIRLDELDKKTREEGTTKGLIRGMLAGLKQQGYKMGGFCAYITSDVLSGSGLSSSAAFETLIGTVVSGLYNHAEIPAVTIAQTGRYAENVYFGKPSGLMDQMACAIGGMVYIDFENEEKPQVEKIDADFEKAGLTLCIVDTKGSHAGLTHEYAQIPVEMKQIAAHFGKNVLREVEEKDFYAALPVLCKESGDRAVLRAIHFFAEDERVVKEVNALRAGDWNRFLKLVKESGDSSYKYLQNVYVSHDTVNEPVAIALAVSERTLADKGVCRVHGGGFAGTIQAFVKEAAVLDYKNAMEAVFGADSCHVLKIRRYGGIRVIG